MIKVEKSDEKEPDTWIVHPTPGYVLKFKEVDMKDVMGDNVKCFVNVCHCKELPYPVEDLNEDQLAARIDTGDFTFRIPLSVGEIDCVRDNKDHNSVKIDVLVNSLFFGKRLAPKEANFFRHYFTMVACDAINDKHRIELNPNNAIKLQNRVKMGDLEPTKIAKKARGEPIIQEVGGASGEEAEPKVVEIEDYPDIDEFEQPSGLSMRLLKGETLEIKMEIREKEALTDMKRLRLRLSSERCVLLVDKSHSLFDFCFPVLIDPKSAKSRLNVQTQTLVVCATVVYP